ncbi:MAG: hypothetical protein AAGI88_09070 [Pseudomonadota bacterium]
MAVLPYQLSEATTLEDLSPIRGSEAVDGTMRYIDMGASTWSRINCVVEALTDTERDGLMTFLRVNRTAEFDVVINSVTYRGRQVPASNPRWSRSRALNTVTFALQAQPI